MEGIRAGHVLAAVALLLAGGLVAARVGGGSGAPAAPAVPLRVEANAAEEGEPGLVVHVAGAVRRPGVYRLRAGLRVDDAVRRAGGPTRRADLSGLNLAAEVEDGRQVLVPRRQAAAAGAGPVVAGAGTAPDAASDAPIDLNTATLEQLDTLEGIGPATAQSILDWRTEHGGFSSVEELGQIPGIGEKRMATLRARLTV